MRSGTLLLRRYRVKLTRHAPGAESAVEGGLSAPGNGMAMGSVSMLQAAI
jgi:hypothetical protein